LAHFPSYDPLMWHSWICSRKAQTQRTL
jgi:hypothetical protein